MLPNGYMVSYMSNEPMRRARGLHRRITGVLT